ncbi:TetR/AcrR family transcriptional regulator [Phascolarctobacterium sp.]|uniref:TetR/AcrR family transcriptional regulator n=1 Tax=Phascolarctobacterium sp. TaxID=2049039 RepID=UPI00386F659E
MKVSGAAPKDQRILAAAEKIFSMYGYEKATLDAIIKLADVGKGTIYKYFGNKEQLFYHLVVGRNEAFVKRLRQAVDAQEGLKDKLCAYFEEFISFYYENNSLWQIICFEMLGGSNACRIQKVDGDYQVLPRYSQLEIKAEAKEQILRYYSILDAEYVILEKILLDGINAGILKAPNDAEATSKYLFFGVAMSIFNPTQNLIEKFNAKEISLIIVDRFLHGECVPETI